MSSPFPLPKFSKAWDTRTDIITEEQGKYARKICHEAPLRALAFTSNVQEVVAADEAGVGALLVLVVLGGDHCVHRPSTPKNQG